MARRPSGWTRVGNAYPSRKAASEWLPFVRGAMRGCEVKVEPCVLEFNGEELTEACKRLLDEKFNLDA